MAAAFRASAVAGNNQTATTNRLTITVPGTAAAGDNGQITVTSSSSTVTLTTPTGWARQSGPDRVGSSASAWLFTKALVAGDVGASVTLQFSSSSRCDAVMEVSSGTTATGLQVAALIESSTTISPTLPTLSSVASGAYVSASLARRIGSTPGPTFTLPSGWTAGPAAKTNFGSSPELSALAGHQVTSSLGAVGGTTATGTAATVGVNYLIAWPASAAGGGVTVAGATAQGSGSSAVGEVTVTTPPPPVWPPDPYRAAVRNGLTVTYTVDATLDGAPVAGAQGMRPVTGTVTDTTAPGVRRTLTVTLAPTPGLYDLLKVPGTTLTVTAHTSVNSVPITDIPMGVYDIDQIKLSVGGGGITITAPDKWRRVQRAKFLGLGVSIPGALVVDQIVALLQGALGSAEPVNVQATSQARMSSQTWDSDRAKAITDNAAGIGAWVFFDRQGVATIADIPTVGGEADWLIDASPSGVLIDVDRESSTTSTFNVVVVSSSAASGEAFPPVTVWDSDPTSPTYAGADPWAFPESAGPLGISVFRFTSSLPLDTTGAQVAGLAILSATVGVASSVSLNSAPNPAIDAFDVLDVLPPRERYDIVRTLERHAVDRVTHPLDVTQPQQIDGRSTRTDPYT